MGYDANEDTYATSCDEFSDSESELSSVEMLFKGYEPNLVVLDGSDHALFGQITELIECLKAAKLIQQVRVSTAFLQGLDVVDDDDDNDEDAKLSLKEQSPEAHALFRALAGLAPICETFICHLHRHLPRQALQQEGGGLLQCVQQLTKLTLNNFLLTQPVIDALGANHELTELRAYFDTKDKNNAMDASIQHHGTRRGSVQRDLVSLDPLFQALAKCPKLQVLDVYAKEDERPEKPRRISGDALTALCHNAALRDLKLWHLDTALVQAVAAALTTTTNLQSLSINKCFVQTEGYTALANMLQTNTSLTKLHISDIVSADACLAFASALKDNAALEELEVTYESNADVVGQAFVDMLETNKTLKQLKLYMSYSFENDMSFSAVVKDELGGGVEQPEEPAAPVGDWETRMDELLQSNREGKR